MYVIADLQLHSRFARAVSKEMTIPNLSLWAKRKGIGLIATGDWTHPLWMKEIQEYLVELGTGFLQLKQEATEEDAPFYLLATEVSCIYSQNGKGRRVHTLIWVPTLDSAMKINKEMTKQGCNLLSDGRPIIGLTNIQVAELVFTIEPNALVIPAHAWTPWFSLYGSMSGFDSLAEAFGPYADRIYAIETGLSSNPAMNWQIAELDNRAIVSFSDAHSGPKLGREATVFDLREMTYTALYEAISAPFLRQESSKNSIAYTIEFYPEEGKYHFTGHRSCNIRWNPEATKTNGTICPVCGKPLTQGVLQRVEELAARSEGELELELKATNSTYGLADEVQVFYSKRYPKRPPYVMLVPLQEIIAECLGSPVTSPKVQKPYQSLLDHFGGEFTVLLKASVAEIKTIAGERIGEGIVKVRRGDIVIDPGYDGVFGVVKLWRDDEEKPLVDASKEQLRIF